MLKEYVFGDAGSRMVMADPNNPDPAPEVFLLNDDSGKLAMIVIYVDDSSGGFPLSDHNMNTLIACADQKRADLVVVAYNRKAKTFRLKAENFYSHMLIAPGTILSERQLAKWIMAIRHVPLTDEEYGLFDAGNDWLFEYQAAHKAGMLMIAELTGPIEDLLDRDCTK